MSFEQQKMSTDISSNLFWGLFPDSKTWTDPNSNVLLKLKMVDPDFLLSKIPFKINKMYCVRSHVISFIYYTFRSMYSLDFFVKKKFGNGFDSFIVIGWCICLIPYFKVLNIPFQRIHKIPSSAYILFKTVCVRAPVWVCGWLPKFRFYSGYCTTCSHILYTLFNCLPTMYAALHAHHAYTECCSVQWNCTLVFKYLYLINMDVGYFSSWFRSTVVHWNNI